MQQNLHFNCLYDNYIHIVETKLKIMRKTFSTLVIILLTTLTIPNLAKSQDGDIYYFGGNKYCQFTPNVKIFFRETSQFVSDSTFTFMYHINNGLQQTITTANNTSEVEVIVNTNTVGAITYTLDSVRADENSYAAVTPSTSYSVTFYIGTYSFGSGSFSACQNQIPFYLGGKKIDTAGVYSLLFKNVYGCDSFATATFSLINNADTATQKDSACYSLFPYNVNGVVYGAPGTYYQKTYDGQATYFYSSDTAVLNTKVNYLYKQLYAYNYGSILGQHHNFGQKSNDISNDLMGNDMVIHSIGYGWFQGDYQYLETRNPNNYRRPDFVRRRYYDMLYTIRGILEAIDSTTQYSTTDKEKIKGQCYGLRAYCYYYLINYYQQSYYGNTTLSGFPIIKEFQALQNVDQSVQDIYNFMLSDLSNAETLLSNKTFSDRTAFSISVVYGFKARIALLMNDWSNAALYAHNAYTSMGANHLMSASQYKNGFNSITNPEWIWGSYIDTNNATGYASFFSHMDANQSGYAQLGQKKKITKALYDTIPVGDVRKTVFQQAASLAPTNGVYTQAITGHTLPTTSSPVYNQLKFRWAISSNFAGDYVYMRTAEMYLIEAEALTKMGNDIQSRAVLETLITTRNPNYSAATLSDTALLNEILLQRRIELWGEGFSLMDIKRNHQNLNRPLGIGNYGSPNLNPVIYTINYPSELFLWIKPMRDSGAIIPCEQTVKIILTKNVVKENISTTVCSNQVPYSWNGNSYSTAGTYYYSTTTYDNVCDSTAVLNLNVAAGLSTSAPTIVNSTSTIMGGQTNVAYSCSTVLGVVNYQWSYSGVGATINGNGSSSITIDFAHSATSGYVSVVAVNANGCSSNAAIINVFVTTVPVVLSSFTAEKSNENVMLKWTTSTEINSKNFEVQRSIDGKIFISIGIVDAKGNSTQTNSYSLVDYNPFAGTNYYRLKQVDMNGKFSLSEMKTVKFNSKDLVDINIYPNPAHSVTTIQIDKLLGVGTIIVTDLYGKQLKIQSLNTTNTTLDISDLAKGVYLVNVMVNKGRVTKKLIVE